MCEVCRRKENKTLRQYLRKFLGRDIGIEIHHGDGYQRLILSKANGDKIYLTADGDTNGFFHWGE